MFVLVDNVGLENYSSLIINQKSPVIISRDKCKETVRNEDSGLFPLQNAGIAQHRFCGDIS